MLDFTYCFRMMALVSTYILIVYSMVMQVVGFVITMHAVYLLTVLIPGSYSL